MFVARDKDGRRVSIKDAKSEVTYYCPLCNSELQLKNKGTIKKHHFAHIKKCTDTWTSDMSDWHLAWQEKFPAECREVVVTSGNVKHRADVLIGNTVIEFQHSKISKEEFNERNTFYTDSGYKVVWVFDMIDEFDDEKITEHPDRDNMFIWKYHWHTFDEYSSSRTSGVQLYFEMDYRNYKKDYELYHISLFMMDRKSFLIDDDDFYKLDDIYEVFSLIAKIKSEAGFSIVDLQDRLVMANGSCYPCFMKNGQVCFENCGCCEFNAQCISRNAVGAPYKPYYDEAESSGCLYRFINIIKIWDIENDKVLDVKYDKNGIVTEFTIKIKGKTINHKCPVSLPQVGKTLLEILTASSANVVGAVNIRTGMKVKIGNSDYFKNRKINKIQGYMGRGEYQGYYNEKRDIYYWDQPEWELEWEK